MQLRDLFRTKSVESILADPTLHEGGSMKRDLGVRDLTALGIAAVIGAGIFATIGEVSFKGGPGVVFLFIFVAIACGFSAMCYASFASMIPISGSAYTYAYASFGELLAWIIGWDLIIEYAIGNIAVAIGWSGYFTEMLRGFGLSIPVWLSTDFLSAYTAFHSASPDVTSEAYRAWMEAPHFLGLRFVGDIPAFGIVLFISLLTFIGISESRKASNLMVLLKLAVIVVVIGIGFFYVKPENWTPFMPNGWGGVLAGVGGVFFAYIGFDAISTTAEECKNPQRDLPLGMIYTLIICTILYILLALVTTGMVNYTELSGVADPLAYIFNKAGMDWIAWVVSLSAVVAMASVLLVFQLGQPRIWMSMSRDGLLPKKFAEIHPKYQTPWFSTIITGLLVSIPALFLNITVVTDLTSIGTLFAFVLVCGGVLILDIKKPELERRFKIPFVDSKYFLLPVTLLLLGYGFMGHPEVLHQLMPQDFGHLETLIPRYIFLFTTLYLIVQSFRYKLSLIPVLGLLTCLYLMSEIPVESWWRFLIWLSVGLVIYFVYGRKNSFLNKAK
ncbi:MAG: amino acid permease [Rhodothermia bacterium]|nr:amino acid permease [Rhodothermia bacterium]